ncbi:hypothetical protein D9M71_421040 [compost metagenome]
MQQAFHLGPLGGVRARDGDANHARAGQGMLQRQGEAGMGAGAAGSQHHGREGFAAGLDLPGQFQAGTHVAQGAQGVGAADGHQVGTLAGGAQAFAGGGEEFVGVVQVGHQFYLGAEQVQQQAVAVLQVIAVSGADGVFQKGDAAKAQARSEGGCLAHVVGLNGAGGDQGIGPLCQGIGGEEFQLAHLVAAQGEGRDVVAFDEHAAAKLAREALQFLQRGGRGNQFQAGKAGEGGVEHDSGSLGSCEACHSSEAALCRQFSEAT